MKYEFPKLTNLAQVRAVVDNVEGFIVAERDWGWVVNYVQMGNQTFPEIQTVEDAIRRECRGLIFAPDGKLISRPLHKFFNVGERTETLLENIDLTRPHVILEKLDGSMIRPIPVGNSFRLGTKMGVTDVAMQAEVWLADHPNYEQFMQMMIDADMTPIFEWCSRKQRIVIDYPIDRLVLIAARHNESGQYMHMVHLRNNATSMDIEVVKEYPGTVENMEALIAEIRDLQGQEGVVLRFDDGHMAKVKATEYVTIHKAKENILRENGVIEMLLDEKSDDIKPFLIDDDRKKVEEYETSFWAGVDNTAKLWKEINDLRHKEYAQDQRKEFAINKAPTLGSDLRSALFKAWDEDPLTYDWRSIVISCIRKNLSSGAKVERARYLWGGKVWNQVEDEI